MSADEIKENSDLSLIRSDYQQLSGTESLGNPPAVTQQEPAELPAVLTQQEPAEQEDPESSNPRQPTTMTTVKIGGVVYQKLGTKKVILKPAEHELYKKDDRKTLSVEERTTLFKSAVRCVLGNVGGAPLNVLSGSHIRFAVPGVSPQRLPFLGVPSTFHSGFLSSFLFRCLSHL
jgi:hypothetical protein